MRRALHIGLLGLVSACSVAGEPGQAFSSGGEGETANGTFDDGGESDTSAAETAGGDGDGDGTTGGDGDGDGSTSGDGDGDGDGTTTGGDGDGDGDGATGDGTTGDGDGTATGDGDGDGDGTYAGHTIVIDGTNDFAADETLATSTPSHTAYVAWDATHVYLGMSGPDVGGADPAVFWVAYLGEAGMTTGETYGMQEPTLPFAASTHVRWKADGTFVDGMTSSGTWMSSPGFFAPADVAQVGSFVEMRIARAALGSPVALNLHMGMLNEMAAGEWTWAATPATSYVDGFDPDYSRYYRFDLAGTIPPAGHLPI